MKEIHIVLEDVTFTKNRHKKELTLIFDKFYMFQEGVPQNIRTMMERVYNMEASTLTGFTDQGSSHL